MTRNDQASVIAYTGCLTVNLTTFSLPIGPVILFRMTTRVRRKVESHGR